MPLWVLILLIPIGEKQFISEVIDTFDGGHAKRECVEALHEQPKDEIYSCMEVK